MASKLTLLLLALIFSVVALAVDNEYVLGVDGLACPFCAYGIEKRLNKVDGVTDVQVDIGESVVRVSLREDKILTRERARQAVDEAGFTLRSFTETQDGTGGSNGQ